MSNLYVLMVVDLQVGLRNTSILGVFSTKEKARRAVTAGIRAAFGGESFLILEDDPEDECDGYFLIQTFKKDVVPS